MRPTAERRDSATSTTIEHSNRLGALAAVVAALASACASTPTPAPREHGAFARPQRGYQHVHVPDVPLPDTFGTRPVSLDAILVYADRHAPRLQVARARLSLGDAARAGASPLLPDNPELSLAVGPGLNAGGDHVDFSASIAQRFEIAGERGLRLQAAERTRERLDAELDEARWEVHRDVHAAFHRALVTREGLGAAERLLAFQERLLDIARRRQQAGDVALLAVRLAEGELSQTRVARIAAEQAYREARLALGALAGWPPTHPPHPAGVLDEPRDPPDARALVEAARIHQPRLRTLDAATDEAVARARAADRDGWIEPTLGVELTRESFAQGPPETQVLGVLSLPVPLWTRNQEARATAAAEARIADAERAAFGSQLQNRIERDRTAVIAAAARVRMFGHEIVPTFEENLRLIQRAFELGEIDILQVSIARERFLRIQTDALTAYVDYFQAVADLEAAIGTDLWPDERHEHSQAEDAAR